MISFSKTVIYCSRWNSWIVFKFLPGSQNTEDCIKKSIFHRGKILSHSFTDFVTLNKHRSFLSDLRDKLTMPVNPALHFIMFEKMPSTKSKLHLISSLIFQYQYRFLRIKTAYDSQNFALLPCAPLRKPRRTL